MTFTYTDMLEKLNIGSAHPGGLQTTKKAWQKMHAFPHDVILDAGCGTGRTLAYLAEKNLSRLIGIDHNKNMIQRARDRLNEYPEVELFSADLTKLPLENETIDGIFSESVTSFIPVKAGLKEYHRILREEGILCLIEITAVKPLSSQEKDKINQFYGTKSVLTKSEWHQAIEEANFSIIDSTPLPATTSDEIEIDMNTEIDPIYFEFLSHHYHLIEKIQNQLIGYFYFCQKRATEVKTDDD